MQNFPFFSVVIPTYNRGDKIKVAIDSVLSQTFESFEIIVVDNGSNDNTKKIMDSYSNSKINYFYQNGSGSPASPRNNGIKKSIAPWICFLDSDDYWLPNKLMVINQAIAENKNVDVFYHYENMLNEKTGKETILSHRRSLDDMYQDLLQNGNKLSTSATTVKRSFLIDHQLFFNESHDFDIVEDYDLWLRIAHKKAKFFMLKEVLGVYVVNENNLIANWDLYLSNLSNLYRKHVYEVQTFKKNKDKLWKDKSIQIELLRMGYLLRSNQFRLLLICIVKNLFNTPFYFFAVLSKKIIN